jgi:hypothetical protein
VSEAISVTISDRLADIDQFMQVVYDGYVEAGYIPPNSNGRRMIPQYLTPGASFILAAVDGYPAGTGICLPEGPWGFPSEEAFPAEFARFRRERRVVECGSFSVRKEFRSLNRRIALAVIATAIRYLNEADDDPQAIITVAPEQERFYCSVFSMERFGDVVPLYGEPAVLLAAPASQVVDGLSLGPGPTRRAVRELVLDPDPDWLVDVRAPQADRTLLPRS